MIRSEFIGKPQELCEYFDEKWHQVKHMIRVSRISTFELLLFSIYWEVTAKLTRWRRKYDRRSEYKVSKNLSPTLLKAWSEPSPNFIKTYDSPQKAFITINNIFANVCWFINSHPSCIACGLEYYCISFLSCSVADSAFKSCEISPGLFPSPIIYPSKVVPTKSKIC